MVEFGGQFGVAPMRLERPTPELAQRGLRCLLDGPERTAAMGRSAHVEEQVAHFLTYAQTIKLDLQRMVVAIQDGCMTAMALWVPAPGKTGVMFIPPLLDHPEALPATEAAMAAALADARAAGLLLVQVMAETRDAVTAEACRHLDFIRLAQLNYMERRPPGAPPAVQLSQGLRLEGYNDQTDDLFREAILGSYEGTLDCPALSGMRDVEDVLAGHKAVGLFDPNLWSVVMDGSTAVGCLLLAEVPARRSLEIVYLGLTPRGRGRGIGRALMQRTLAIGCRRGFEIMTLAVDAENVPALKLYRRFGYGEMAQRIAFIKKLGE